MTVDIIVVGSGPGGAVVASKLAQQGYRIAVITKPRRLPALEGLSERALNGLRHAGCQHALATSGPQVMRLADWNGERFEGNREWLVERSVFDAALLQDLQDAGIDCIRGQVRGIRRHDNRWRVNLAAAHQPAEMLTCFVIDARGRAAPHLRATLRRGPTTIALGRCWAMLTEREPFTRVASFTHGWAWFAKGASGPCILQLFVSAESSSLPPRPRLEEHYHELLRALPEAEEWLAGARPMGSVFARYAHPQFDSRLLEDGYARVGDAAFAIDPLSGHGIYEAIGGALALAATVNTLLARPQDSETAARFYWERIESDFLRMSRIGRDFYRLEQRWPEQPFWHERHSWPDLEPAHVPPDRAAPRIERRPVNNGGFITLEEVIVTPDHPRGIWQVAGVTLVPLLRELGTCQGDTLAAIAGSHAARHRFNPVDCQTALAWLAARRLLTAVRV